MKEKYPVIEGAEAFYYKGNDIGILISHGFVGTPQSVRYIGERFADHGYTVLAPRLPGHGTHYHDLEKATHEDWFAELERGYQFLAEQCSTVFMVGQSMGGTLTLKMAQKYPEIKGVVTVNAALTLPSFEYLKQQQTPKYIPEGEPDIKAKGVYEITYHKTPLHAIHQLQELMENTPALLEEITSPILCIKSTVDHVIPPTNTDFIYKNVGSKIKAMATLENSYHVASMDNDKEVIVEHVHRFVQSQLINELVTTY
ncbi:carboxylesterase [Mesobacillus persicus]|uniref:Carboxylesterase n=1 Tax=Mesobacillus persicus TaxID=930146 RepID=A0A1H7WCW7_9BACI|nr:alpha/beta fold hydrolase [Mesobacillus persicus]SEM18848.1 carboxylesterase [Mesobacillus persicus]